MNLDEEKGRLKLRGAVEIEAVDPLKDALLTLLALPVPTIVVDLTEVTDTDLAIIQLFHAAHLSSRLRNKNLVFLNIPEKVNARLDLAGLSLVGRTGDNHETQGVLEHGQSHHPDR
ncbi:MAG: STAS domain-containing protein [Magnetococcales bacterium]|nr:STAS domain-containing protein [Magnetococcales bacterium]